MRHPAVRRNALLLSARLALVPLFALGLAGCDAGHREAPGIDNTLSAPAVSLSTPYEGQTVVRSRQGAPVLAKIDLTGALGRTAGSTLRYRLDSGGVEGTWAPVADVDAAFALGDLKAGDAHVLTVEVLDAKGEPWTRVETTGTGASAVKRTLHPQSTCVRHFSVADAWAKRE